MATFCPYPGNCRAPAGSPARDLKLYLLCHEIQGMKTPAPGLRGEILVLFYAVQHPAAPVLPKLVAAASLLYLLSPIDLIPDFIPFAGWLDDLVVVPLLLHLSYRLLPTNVVRESRLRAIGQGRRLRRLAWTALILIIAAMAGIYWYYHTKG